jgi:hypothetical protein
LPPDFARAALARRPDGFDVLIFRWGSAIPHSSLAQANLTRWGYPGSRGGMPNRADLQGVRVADPDDG